MLSKSLMTPSSARKKLAEHIRARRLGLGLTQQGLAYRSGVKLATLRKFEQKGSISLESFLKLLVALGGLERVVEAVEPDSMPFSSIEGVLDENRKTPLKRGWRT